MIAGAHGLNWAAAISGFVTRTFVPRIGAARRQAPNAGLKLSHLNGPPLRPSGSLPTYLLAQRTTAAQRGVTIVAGRRPFQFLAPITMFTQLPPTRSRSPVAKKSRSLSRMSGMWRAC